MMMRTIDHHYDPYDDDPVYKHVLFYVYLFFIGFIPGIMIGYLLWG